MASQKYAESLTKEALEYLSARGITAEAAVGNLLGVAVNPEPGHENLRNRLTIPYITPAGVVSIKARAMHGEEPKYAGLTGVDLHLYNVMALHRDEDYIAVCEGELDALVCDAVVGIPAVGVPGVHAWKKHHHRVFAGYSRVFVITDDDVPKKRPSCAAPACKSAGDCLGHNPGRELQERIVGDLRDQAVVVPPPPGLDLGEWLLRDGPEAIRKACGL